MRSGQGGSAAKKRSSPISKPPTISPDFHQKKQPNPELQMFCNDWTYVRYLRARCESGLACVARVCLARAAARRSPPHAPPNHKQTPGAGTCKRRPRCCTRRCSGELDKWGPLRTARRAKRRLNSRTQPNTPKKGASPSARTRSRGTRSSARRRRARRTCRPTPTARAAPS